MTEHLLSRPIRLLRTLIQDDPAHRVEPTISVMSTGHVYVDETGIPVTVKPKYYFEHFTPAQYDSLRASFIMRTFLDLRGGI